MCELLHASSGVAPSFAARRFQALRLSSWVCGAMCALGFALIVPAVAADTAAERRQASPAPSIEEDNRSERRDALVGAVDAELPGASALTRTALPAGIERPPRPKKDAVAAIRLRPRVAVPLRKRALVDQIRRAAFSSEKGS